MLEDKKRWRLRRDFKKGKFCFLIGIDNWSIELQKSEFESLYFLLLKINAQLLGIKNELMAEESITLVLEQLPWFIELEGKKNEWSLRFVFESQDETRSFDSLREANSPGVTDAIWEPTRYSFHNHSKRSTALHLRLLWKSCITSFAPPLLRIQSHGLS